MLPPGGRSILFSFSFSCPSKQCFRSLDLGISRKGLVSVTRPVGYCPSIRQWGRERVLETTEIALDNLRNHTEITSRRKERTLRTFWTEGKKGSKLYKLEAQRLWAEGKRNKKILSGTLFCFLDGCFFLIFSVKVFQ